MPERELKETKTDISLYNRMTIYNNMHWAAEQERGKDCECDGDRENGRARKRQKKKSKRER
jgi:hypothetical protein